MRHYYLFCIILSFLSACTSGGKDKKADLHTINLEQVDTCSFYDIFSKAEIIPLETNSESIFSVRHYEPDRMIIRNNKFYFLDRTQQTIVIFDSKGKFLKKISKKGRGPGEYNGLRDFSVNRFTGDIELMSHFGYVNIYDSVGESFKKQIKVPQEVLAIHYFVNLTPDIYLFFSNSREGNKMLFYSVKENKIIKEDYNAPRWLITKTTLKHSKNPFYVINDTVCFAQVYDGKIFNISASEPTLTTRYSWDFGEHTLKLSMIPENKELNFYMDYVRNLKRNYAIQFFIYKENSQYYFTRFNYKSKHLHLMLSKKDGSYTIFEKFKEGFQFTPLHIDDQAAYACSTPEYLKYIINPDILDEENLARYNSIKNNDNPVIVKYTFK